MHSLAQTGSTPLLEVPNNLACPEELIIADLLVHGVISRFETLKAERDGGMNIEGAGVDDMLSLIPCCEVGLVAKAVYGGRQAEALRYISQGLLDFVSSLKAGNESAPDKMEYPKANYAAEIVNNAIRGICVYMRSLNVEPSTRAEEIEGHLKRNEVVQQRVKVYDSCLKEDGQKDRFGFIQEYFTEVLAAGIETIG